ncbi:CBS domain-containing protein [Nodularia chucula]|uniref:CBS domain-containing protein n=1 Tax=Nodularia chucula TaxID=3093667 RepID=UPI0039C5B69C
MTLRPGIESLANCVSLELPTLKNVIYCSPLTVTADTRVVDAIAFMSQARGSNYETVNQELPPNPEKASCVLVISQGQLLGIFTEWDVVRLTAMGVNLSEITIAEVMIHPVITIQQSQVEDMLTVLSILHQHRIHHLPVVDDNNYVIGVITHEAIRQVLQPANLLKLRSVSEVTVNHDIYAPLTARLLDIAQLMNSQKINCVVIAEPDSTGRITPQGIITEGDIVQFQVLGLDFTQIQAQTVMSTPLFCVHPEDILWFAHREMQRRYLRRLVVTNETGEFLGIVTQTSFLQLFDPLEITSVIAALQEQVAEQGKELKQSNQQLQQEVIQRRQAEEKLHQAYTSLEQQVAQRTAELSQANALLQQENEERKRAEEKIREQAALIDIATNAIFVCNLERRILFWNQGAEGIYQWLASEVLGKNANEILYEKTSPELESVCLSVLKDNSWQGELHQVTKYGEKIIVQSRWTLVRDKFGEPKSILIVNTDITEKKQLEAKFLRTQRLENLGILASGIAHDLNNILTPILTSTQLLPLRLGNVDEQSRQLLKMQQDSAKRGAELIKQILSFAQGVEGKHFPLQARHLLKEIEQLIKSTFPKSIAVQTYIPNTISSIIVADPTQIHQVLMNLCVNARDAMPNGGILGLEADNFFVDEHYAQMNPEAKICSYIVITVSDTGSGIPPELLKRIFEPFFTTKEFSKGTGLGLSTIIGILKNHGGFIDVESQVGLGSNFKVYLPVSDQIVTEETDKSKISQGNGELILIVDDEDSIRATNKATLESYNYRILTASDGIEAVSVYAQHKNEISVILMDIEMPSMDGIRAIQVICKINPAIKIVAISGLVSNKNRLKGIGACVPIFLSKPYTLKELLETVQMVLVN